MLRIKLSISVISNSPLPSARTVCCQREYDTARERSGTGNQPSYAEAKKMKSLAASEIVCLGQDLNFRTSQLTSYNIVRQNHALDVLYLFYKYLTVARLIQSHVLLSQL